MNKNPSQPKTNTNLLPFDHDYFLSIPNFPQTSKFQKNFSKTPFLEEMFKCLLCSKTLVDPVTDPCGHSFCGVCILEARKKINQCPVSFEKYETEEEFPVNILIESILQAELPCENKFLGCQWLGNRGNMKEHVEKKCEYASFQCENIKCKRIFQRKEIGKHIKECVYNAIMCQECGWSGPLNEIEAHYAKCPERKVACPLECGNEIKRKDLQKHYLQCTQKNINDLYKQMNSIRPDKIDSIAEEIYRKDFANLQYKHKSNKSKGDNKKGITEEMKEMENRKRDEESWERRLMMEFQGEGEIGDIGIDIDQKDWNMMINENGNGIKNQIFDRDARF